MIRVHFSKHVNYLGFLAKFSKMIWTLMSKSRMVLYVLPKQMSQCQNYEPGLGKKILKSRHFLKVGPCSQWGELGASKGQHREPR